MFHFLFRAVGMVVLAMSLVTAVLDLTRSIAASTFVLTSFEKVWEGISPGSLQASQNAVETLVHPVLWNPLIASVLTLPAFIVLFLLAMVFLWTGQRRENRFGRFASR